MPQKSRYDNAEIETIMNDILLVLEKHKANHDLSLMVLGNVTSHVFNHAISKENREALAETFTNILQKSIIK